ncbi:hypothetical protein Bpfe_030487, partial [Biomphalaria pfeifferi]
QHKEPHTSATHRATPQPHIEPHLSLTSATPQSHIEPPPQPHIELHISHREPHLSHT